MTEDIWDELWNKPAFNFLSYNPDELVQVPGKLAVNKEWLHEVKAEGDKLEANQCPWTELTIEQVSKEFGERIIKKHQIKPCADCIKEIQEKAEKYLMLYNEAIKSRDYWHDKREAIKNQIINLSPKDDLMKWQEGVLKILEVEG